MPTHNEYADEPGIAPALVDDAATVTRKLSLSLIVEPLDPMRHDMDDGDMQELMDDIKQTGLLHALCVVPILNGVRVRLVGEGVEILDHHERRGGMYRVAAGHRRLIACRGIRLVNVECKVWCDTSVPEEQIMAAENTHREDASDYDLACLYAKWLKEPGMTESALRKRAGKSIDYVYNRAAILEGWEFVGTALHKKQINFAVAKAINREPDEAYAKHFLNMAIDQGATSRLVNAWISEHKAHVDMAAQPGPAPTPGVSVVVPQNNPIECLICGDKQSYNLQTVLMCGADIARIKEARASVGEEGAAT